MFLLRPQLLLRLGQFLAQAGLRLLALGQLNLQRLVTLPQLVGLLLDSFPAFRFFGQRLGQSLDFFFRRSARGLQFPGARFELGPFDSRVLLVGEQLFFRLLQFAAQFRLRLEVFGQFGFQFCLAMGELLRPQFGGFAALGLGRQRFHQCLDALFDGGLIRLQFLHPRLPPGLLVPGALLLRPLLLLRGGQRLL